MSEIIEIIGTIISIWILGAFGVLGCIAVTTLITSNTNQEMDNAFNTGTEIVKSLNKKYFHVAAFILGAFIANATGIII